MRVFSFIPALAALVTAVVAQDNCGYEIGCDVVQSLASKRDFFERPTGTARGLTNAALLRRGLPLKNPIMRRGTPVRRTDPSAAPDPNPEPKEPEPKEPGPKEPVPDPKKAHRGIISVKRLSDGNVLGYISRTTIGAGLYRYETGPSNALIVNFETDSDSGAQLNIIPENAALTDFGFLGLVQGRDNTDSVLSSGSFYYSYLMNTHETAPNSPPEAGENSWTSITGSQRTSESAVWTYDSATGSLSPRWVNPDGTVPEVQYFTQGTAVYIGGDADAFFSRYPAPVIRIVFEFVEL